MFNYLWRSADNLRALYETPVLPDEHEVPIDRRRAEQIVDAARAEGRTLLTELESKELLAGLRHPDHRDARRADGSTRRWRRRRHRLPGGAQAAQPHRSRTRPTSAA
jgi:acyl-CoA synthetase (NDP forming)